MRTLLVFFALVVGVVLSAPAPAPSPSGGLIAPVAPVAPVVYSTPLAYSYNSYSNFQTHPLTVKVPALYSYPYSALGYGYNYPYVLV